MKKQSGFALVELLLVLAIIAILTVIALPSLLGQRARARDKAAMANATALIGDMVAGFDKCRENGIAITTASSFATNVLGSSSSPQIASFFTARNPWGTPAGAYASVIKETSAAGSATLLAAKEDNLGQVQVGFLPRSATDPAVLSVAVYLSQPLHGAAPAAAGATKEDKEKTAADGHKYSRVISLD
jgi:prepilin-type N-terminal cleavage/methylation domain-containing protein